MRPSTEGVKFVLEGGLAKGNKKRREKKIPSELPVPVQSDSSRWKRRGWMKRLVTDSPSLTPSSPSLLSRSRQLAGGREKVQGGGDAKRFE
ncbi:hypothetical protein E2C01_019872 [Portunus trituberculatus]|uniref:Uncharacterized protein n=1 Tax=Portunus trituberculatus TaxID=210409 RepID=A0A5B7DZT6_PORTR|nr:hypothetical protein [Portunus trituberculatus]